MEGEDDFNLLFIADKTDYAAAYSFIMTPPSRGELELYRRDCRLNSPAFSVSFESGRMTEDLTAYERDCVPS